MPRSPRSTLFPYTTLFRSVPGWAMKCSPRCAPPRPLFRSRFGDCTAEAATTTAFRASDRKSTRLNSSHTVISYAVFCLKKKRDEAYGQGVEANRHEGSADH